MEKKNMAPRLDQLHTEDDARRMLAEFRALYNTPEGKGSSLYPGEVPAVPR